MQTAIRVPSLEDELAGYRVELDARLVEEATLRAVASLPAEEQRLFHRQRDPLYELEPGAGREAAFQELHGRWLGRLELAKPVYRCLSEEPSVPRSTSRCLVLVAPSGRQEYADLRRQDGAGKPALILRLRPQTLVDGEALVSLLQRELVHIADLVDLDFGFEPGSDGARVRPALEKLVRERYRVLWETTVDGRLAARGCLPAGAEEARRHQFLATFGMLGKAAEDAFETFFRARPSHAELLAFAVSPADGGRGQGPSCCSLCQLPTAVFHSGRLSPETLQAIRHDFPEWTADAGLCPQCADLYQSRV